MKKITLAFVMTCFALSATSSFAESSLESFERIVARITVGCGGLKTTDAGYGVIDISDCTSNERLSGGYSLSDNPGHPYLGQAVSRYQDGAKPLRNIDFVSRDHALNETFLYLEDLAGGPDSHDVKSVVLLLPRLGVPVIEVSENELIVRLTTGEKVVFDKTTHAIKSGALEEGPIDLTTDRFKRQPPNIFYTGSGISIRVNHRYEYPTMGAILAEVRQGTRVCQVQRSILWDSEGQLLTQDDQSILELLNKKCPKKANEDLFHL